MIAVIAVGLAVEQRHAAEVEHVVQVVELVRRQPDRDEGDAERIQRPPSGPGPQRPRRTGRLAGRDHRHPASGPSCGDGHVRSQLPATEEPASTIAGSQASPLV